MNREVWTPWLVAVGVGSQNHCSESSGSQTLPTSHSKDTQLPASLGRVRGTGASAPTLASMREGGVTPALRCCPLSHPHTPSPGFRLSASPLPTRFS